MGRIISIHPDNPEPRILEQAVEVLRSGGVLIYPTDTIYGLGCDITHASSVEKICRIKGRDPEKPLSIVCSSISDVTRYAKVTNFSFRIIKSFLPGPYTFVLQARKEVPPWLRNRKKTVGIRIPDHPVPLQLVERLGSPILSTSANRSGEDVITDPEDLVSSFSAEVDMVLSCGILPVLPSTVVSLLRDETEILRRGAGPFPGEG